MWHAVKVIDKQAHKADILYRLRRESELMESLDHPNIIKLHEVIETQFSIYICMEYIEGTSLEQYLKIQDQGKLHEKEARRIIRELASAIAHCHSRFIVHRDLKPANVLITPGGKVILIDFGLGNVFSNRSRLHTICGSLPYYSPEIARGSNYTGPEVDIWCLGVVLYRMTVGRDPFVGSTKREVKYQIVQDSFQLPSALSAGLQQTLRKLLSPDSGRRRSLTLLEGDPWLHEDIKDQFVSEDRGSESNRLSGTTLVRQSSKTTWKRHSLTESYSRGQAPSTLGSHSLLETCAWQLDKTQPRFHKNRIRIVSSPDVESHLLYQKDVDLSLLQFLMPILAACQVSYYLHSTTRILCGSSFLKDSGQYSQPSVVLQKFVHHVGAAMTGAPTEATKESLVRCGVFSVDIVRAKPGMGNQTQGRYLLIIKRLIGSSSTVQHFKKQFLLNATRDVKQLQ
ncbi:Serine/threonine-protein kinase par-1 [Podila minutissima]|uniref:Serine/threonine-protein kinase par-1 n=1 Tax=Podila minutissima TaxID=64525 RepID=A0A9P5VP51_9FUNG|nr:Serine/threonine-protein kinase par-1 [Podila minutissima]